MKAIIIIGSIVISLGLLGCGADKTSQEYYQAKVEGWQAREALCPKIETPCPIDIDNPPEPGIPMGVVVSALIDRLPKIDHIPDPEDRWQTSCETLESGAGDCEDKATLAWRVVKDSCLSIDPELYPAIRVLDVDGGSDHIVAVVYNGDHIVYEVDNLYTKIKVTDARVLYEY